MPHTNTTGEQQKLIIFDTTLRDGEQVSVIKCIGRFSQP